MYSIRSLGLIVLFGTLAQISNKNNAQLRVNTFGRHCMLIDLIAGCVQYISCGIVFDNVNIQLKFWKSKSVFCGIVFDCAIIKL